jgi:hypothetical protein
MRLIMAVPWRASSDLRRAAENSNTMASILELSEMAMKALHRGRTTAEQTEIDLRPMRPAPGGHLSDGLVVEASVLARLIGLRLLRLEARIAFVPTDFGGPSADLGLDLRTLQVRRGCLSDAVSLLEHASHTLVEAHRDSPAARTPPRKRCP